MAKMFGWVALRFFLRQFSWVFIGFLRILRTLYLDRPCLTEIFDKNFMVLLATPKIKMKVWGSEFGFCSPSTRFFHSFSRTVGAFVAFSHFAWPFSRRALFFFFREHSALNKFLVVCYGCFVVIFLRCMAKAANVALRLSRS